LTRWETTSFSRTLYHGVR